MQRRLLVIDDHVPSREGLKQWFRGLGWQVETAADGWEALKWIKETSFEAAIVDLDLPPVHGIALSGWDVVRIVRAFRPEMSIVVLSAQGGHDVKVQADRLSVAEFVEKPISPTRLHALAGVLGARVGCAIDRPEGLMQPQAGGNG